MFAHYFGIGLSQSIWRTGVASFKKFVLDAARGDAFTKLSYKGKWSPIYVQSNVLRLIAMYMVFAETKGLLTAEEKKLLVSWGNKMVPGQKSSKQSKSADSRAASGVALISWGSVTGNSGVISAGKRKVGEGLSYVLSSAGKLKRHPAHRSIPTSDFSLEDEYNIALAHVIEGATMLENMGSSLYATKKNGKNLHDAVAWWASVIAKRPKGFIGYARHTHNFHVGWIPIYLHRHSGKPATATLRKIASSVSRGKRPMFSAISLGGPTDCFWRYR